MARRTFGTVRKLPSGRWQAFHEAGGRHTAPHTFRTKADAQAWLAVQEAERAQGSLVSLRQAKLTVAELAELWLVSNPAKRWRTVCEERYILGRHVLPVIGHLKVTNVTQADVERLVRSWQAHGAAVSTVRRRGSCVRAMFQWAVRARYIARSPATVALPTAGQVDRPELSPEDLERLGKALGEWEPMLWLMAVAGLRWSEVAALRAEDLDLDERNIHVARQLDRHREDAALKSEAGKRVLAIPEWLADMLRHYEPGYLFTNSSGKPLVYSNWRRTVWLPALARAGLRIRPHDLRSLHATELVAAGADVKTLQHRLGHASPQVSLSIYARVKREQDRKAAEAVGEALRPARSLHADQPAMF